MKIYKEISLEDFEAWSGAVDTIETLKKLERNTNIDFWNNLECCIDDIGEGIGETELNDILWFETDTIAEWLGYEDWEHLEKIANGEDEEIEFLYSVGDMVNANGRKAQIDTIDYNDRELPYYVKYIDRDELEAIIFEWCGIDEIEEWKEDEE